MNRLNQKAGFSMLEVQNYRATDRAAMLFPFGNRVDTSFVAAATHATPRMGVPMRVHSIPVTYQRQGHVSRLLQRVGMVTPKTNGVQ